MATNHGPSAAALGQLLSTLLGAALVVRGVLALPTSHIEAYRWFLRGILVWLLITQVFIFYDSQPIGLAGLAFDVVAYAMLRYAISHEIDPSTPRDRDPTQTRDRPDRTAARPTLAPVTARRRLAGIAGSSYRTGMCRSIKTLRRADEAATTGELEAAARQYVRKISGYRTPSARNTEAFEAAIRRACPAKAAY